MSEQSPPGSSISAPDSGPPVPDSSISPPFPGQPVPGSATSAAPRRETGAGSRSTARLVSASALMAGGTLVSRVLGFGRLMLLTVLFGNGTRQAEMFTLANTIPNSMYILLAGGVLNTVLVPQIVRAIKGDKDRGEAYTNRIMTGGLIVLGVITVAADRGRPVDHRHLLRARLEGPGALGAVPVDDHARLLLHAAGLLLRRVRPRRPDPERARPVRPDDVGPDRQQRRLHRRAADLPGHLRRGRHRERRSPPVRNCCSARLDARASRSRRWCCCRSCARPATGSGRGSTSGTPASARPSGWPSGPSASCWSPNSP